MDRWLTDMIDRLFFSEPTADSLRHIMLLAAFAQGGIVFVAFVLARHAIECGLTQHHGTAILCTVGVIIAVFCFEVVLQTRKRAQTARQELVNPPGSFVG